MQSDNFEETLRILKELISDRRARIDCIVLSPSLLGGLLSDPRLQGQLVFTYGEVPDPSDLPLLCL